MPLLIPPLSGGTERARNFPYVTGVQSMHLDQASTVDREQACNDLLPIEIYRALAVRAYARYRDLAILISCNIKLTIRRGEGDIIKTEDIVVSGVSVSILGEWALFSHRSFPPDGFSNTNLWSWYSSGLSFGTSSSVSISSFSPLGMNVV